jgi:hypothetical protein
MGCWTVFSVSYLEMFSFSPLSYNIGYFPCSEKLISLYHAFYTERHLGVSGQCLASIAVSSRKKGPTPDGSEQVLRPTSESNSHSAGI